MTSTYKRIIAAVDGSEYAEWTFKKGIEMAKRNNAELHILHVFDVRYYPSHYTAIKEKAEHDGIELLKRYKKEAESHNLVKVDTILKFGSPKVQVSKTAEEIKADLILCGASGLYAVEQVLLGSVTESIVRHAKCDVLVVRRPKSF